eukprot:5221572-Pleurochrysis_carterae.AAC.1
MHGPFSRLSKPQGTEIGDSCELRLAFDTALLIRFRVTQRAAVLAFVAAGGRGDPMRSLVRQRTCSRPLRCRHHNIAFPEVAAFQRERVRHVRRRTACQLDVLTPWCLTERRPKRRKQLDLYAQLPKYVVSEAVGAASLL